MCNIRGVYLCVFRHYILMLWITILIFLFCKMFRIYNKEPEYAHLRRMLGITLCISRGTVPLIYLMISLIIFPVCKTFNQIMHRALNKCSKRYFSLYIEHAKIIHITLTVGLLFVSFIHSLAHVLNARNYIRNFSEANKELNWAHGRDDHLWRLLFLTPAGASGLAMLLILFILWISSRRSIRDHSYRIFSITHHLFILFLLLIYVHASGNIIKYQSNVVDQHLGNYSDLTDQTQLTNNPTISAEFKTGIKLGWICPTIAIALYLADQIYRFISRNSSQLIVLEALPFPGRAIFLRFQFKNRKLSMNPCDYILLNCPTISLIEWHPFTITECPTLDDPSFTILIRARGDWTDNLYAKVKRMYGDQEKCNLLVNSELNLEFNIDGPFPSPFGNISSHKICVFIAAGIGITPFMSILNEIKKTHKYPKRVHLIWITRKLEQILWCSRLFNLLVRF